jgi:hypothetical protein
MGQIYFTKRMIIWIMAILFLVSCDKGPFCYECVITKRLSIGYPKFAGVIYTQSTTAQCYEKR